MMKSQEKGNKDRKRGEGKFVPKRLPSRNGLGPIGANSGLARTRGELPQRAGRIQKRVGLWHEAPNTGEIRIVFLFSSYFFGRCVSLCM